MSDLLLSGYPGIPPGPDRPQAAVKGSIELRAGHQGIKAKWVRIELRKVETLPGGGQANTFHDFVGQSPVNVWQTSEEYGILETVCVVVRRLWPPLAHSYVIHSKTSHFISGYPNLYPPAWRWRKAVSGR